MLIIIFLRFFIIALNFSYFHGFEYSYFIDFLSSCCSILIYVLLFMGVVGYLVLLLKFLLNLWSMLGLLLPYQIFWAFYISHGSYAMFYLSFKSKIFDSQRKKPMPKWKRTGISKLGSHLVKPSLKSERKLSQLMRMSM